MKSDTSITVLPVLKAAQFVGLLPCVRFQPDRLHRSQSLLYTFVAISLLFLSPAAVVYFADNVSKPESERVTSGIFLLCVTFANVVHVAFLVCYGWYFAIRSCKVVSATLSAFLLVEKTTKVNLKKFKTPLLVYQCVALFACLALCLAFIVRLTMLSNWQIQLILNFARLQIFVVEQFVVVFSLIFAVYFRFICKCVTECPKGSLKIKVNVTKASRLAWGGQPAATLGVRECFSRLSDALNTLQKEVSLFLLLDVMQLTVNIVAFLAFIIVKGLHRNRSMTFLVIFVDAVIRIVILTFSCGQVTEEAESVAEAASCAINPSMDEATKEELRMLMDEARCRQLKFWALGLFTVDRPLLYSIVGSAISYLVIISQLQKE